MDTPLQRTTGFLFIAYWNKYLEHVKKKDLKIGWTEKLMNLGGKDLYHNQELSTLTVLAQIVSQTTLTSLHRELLVGSGYVLIVIQTSS